MYEVFEQLLQKFGVTPYKISKQTGVTQTTLSNWKNGKSTPSNGKKAVCTAIKDMKKYVFLLINNIRRNTSL